MCPLWPFHYVILYILLFLSAHFIVMATSKNLSLPNNVMLNPTTVNNLRMSETRTVDITLPNTLVSAYELIRIEMKPSEENIVICSPSLVEVWKDRNPNQTAAFNVTGHFLGSTQVMVKLTKRNSEEIESLTLPVVVTRKERLIDKVFTISVATLVSVLFINFGCALDWKVLVESFKRPSSLLVGIVTQFIFMPLISYIIGYLIFPTSVAMRLGLFFTGISPSGGASNLYVCMFEGNLNLSVALTTLGNFFAFLTIPLWTFTLGQSIFSTSSVSVVYSKVATFAFTLLPPLLIGLVLQKKCPKFSQLMVSILKPLSSLLILFIIVFATLTNLYLFELFTGKILLAGFLVPAAGFIVAILFSFLFNRTVEDRIAISVETAVQNTGIAIFMLRFSLPQPEADLTTVIPVAVALMTPVPLMMWYGCSKLHKRVKNGGEMKPVKSVPVDERSAISLIDDKSSPSVE